ncbi:MAG: hypothetical protein V3569_03130 [Acholeplasmataceae bacterium]|nr:hypothetical protein [Acholeplasmataceae bacterium]
MKKKELINLIKDKADHIEIRNMSSEILSKVGKAQFEEIKQPKIELNLKKWLFPSLSAVLAVFMFFFVFGLFSTPINVDAYNETIALSTLSSVTMIENNPEMKSNELTGVLLVDDGTEASEIESEIPTLETFFTWAEQLLASDESLSILKEKSPLADYQYQLIFETSDLLNEQLQYGVYFNESIQKRTRTFTLEGLIISNDIPYLFTATADDNKGEMTVMISDREGVEIEVTSSIKDSDQAFLYRQKFQGEIKEEVEFKWIREGLDKRIDMAFSGRTTRGNYQIRLEQNMMRIEYRIENDTTEEGELDVEIIENEEGNYYGITVRVAGRPAFTYGNVERGRPNAGFGRN